MKTYLGEEEQAHSQSNCNFRLFMTNIRSEIQQELNNIHRCLIKLNDGLRLRFLREMIGGSAVLGGLDFGLLNIIIDLLCDTIIIIIMVILLIDLISVVLLLI